MHYELCIVHCELCIKKSLKYNVKPTVLSRMAKNGKSRYSLLATKYLRYD